MIPAVRIIEGLIEPLILLLLVSAPVAFGSVHVIAYSALETGCMAIFCLWAMKAALSGQGFDRRLLPLLWLWLGFIALGVFMLVPVPASWAAMLSPKAHEIFTLSIKGYGDRAYDVYRSLSLAPHLTLSSLLKTAAYGSVFFVAAHELRDRGKARRFVLVLMLVGLGEAIFGLYNFFHAQTAILGIERDGFIRAASGTYINRNHFAGLLGMVFFAGMGMLLSLLPPRDFPGKSRALDAGGFLWPVSASLALTAVGVGFSLSRMAMAGGLATFVLVLLVLGRQGMRRHVALALAAAGLGLALLAGYGLEPLIQRLDTANLASTRPEIWGSTLAMAKEFPLLGSGMGTFREVFQLYAPGGIPSLTLQAHSDYLELISETGAIGGAMGIAAIGYFITLAVREQHKTPDHEERMLSLGALCGVCYILLFSITDFNLQIPANAMVFSAIAGLALAAALGPERADASYARFGRLKAAIAVSLAITASFFALSQMRAEMVFPVERAFFRTAEELVPSSKPEAALAMRASRLVPMNASYHLALGQHRMNEALRYTPDEARKSLEQARVYFTKALQLNPASLQTRGRLAWAWLASGDYLSGMRELDTALDIAPTSHLSHLSFAQAVTTYTKAFPPSLRTPLLYRAQSEYTEAIRLNPSLACSVHVVMGIADMHMLSGGRMRAMETLASYVVYTPEALPAHLRLARMHIEDSDWMKAALLYRRLHAGRYRLDTASRSTILNALRADAKGHPDAMPLQRVLAEVSAASGNHEARIEALERMMAYSRNPGFRSETAADIGKSLEAIGQSEKAISMYAEALALDPSNGEARRRLVALMLGAD